MLDGSSYAQTAKAHMREAILDAAYDVVVAHGWGAARMTDIAARVGLSRQTLYNEFGSKEGLAREVVLRETGRFLEGIHQVLAEYADDLERSTEEAVLFTFRHAAEKPLLKAILTSDHEDDLLPLLTTRSEPVLLAAKVVLVKQLQRDWPALPGGDVDLVADSLVRLTISHLLLPLEAPDVVARNLARLVHRYLTATTSGGTP
jgi:AcrR family transcriptional regulator